MSLYIMIYMLGDIAKHTNHLLSYKKILLKKTNKNKKCQVANQTHVSKIHIEFPSKSVKELRKLEVYTYKKKKPKGNLSCHDSYQL